jgi:hypothetical protein
MIVMASRDTPCATSVWITRCASAHPANSPIAVVVMAVLLSVGRDLCPPRLIVLRCHASFSIGETVSI